jgi:CheY-like chemotaxis protein
MDSEFLKRIFRPFRQADSSTSRNFGGTGLGLSIAQRLVELMQGQLQVESSPGTGSRFWFDIPLSTASSSHKLSSPDLRHALTADFDVVDPAPSTGESKSETAQTATPLASPSASAAASSPAQSCESKILVAEDEMVNRKVLCRMLDQLKWRWEAARDGIDAVARIRQDRAAFRIVLMDVHMPYVDGITATKAIRADEARESAPKAYIVAVTADVMLDRASTGMDDLLPKPVDRDALRAVLERATATLKQRSTR